MTEGRKQRTEDRRQTSEDRRLTPDTETCMPAEARRAEEGHLKPNYMNTYLREI
jgi:hypothetical protein